MKTSRDIKKDLSAYLNLKNIRELSSLQSEDYQFNFTNDTQNENLIISKPYKIFDEWPNEEILKKFNKNNEAEKLNPKKIKYSDENNKEIKLPKSLEKLLQNNIKWLRPEEYILNNLLQREIRKNYPNKNTQKFISEIKDYFFNVELLLRRLDDALEKNEDIFKEKISEEMENENSIILSNKSKDEEKDKDERNLDDFNNDKESVNNKENFIIRENDNKNIQRFNEFKEEELYKYRNYDLETIRPELIDLFNEYNTRSFNLFFQKIKNNENFNNNNGNLNNLVNGSPIRYCKNIFEKYIIITEPEASFSIKRDYYKKIYRVLERDFTFTVVNYSYIKEFNKNYYNNDRNILMNLKNDNNNTNIVRKDSKTLKENITNNNQFQEINTENSEEIPIGNKVDIKLGNLTFEKDENYFIFNKWISSILQLIKDIDLKDIETNKSIIFNIYPQKDDIPVLSNTGKYWIKLYHMGLPRKIEIDDRQPCSLYDEYFLPQSERHTEIWPGLFTKAILKLYSYKFQHNSYNEIGDLSIIYSLTGYYMEKINISSVKGKALDKFFDKFFNEESYLDISNDNFLFLNKINALSCLNLGNESSNENKNNKQQQVEETNDQKRNFKFSFKVLEEEKELDISKKRKSEKPKILGKFLKTRKTAIGIMTKNKIMDIFSKKNSENKIEESVNKNTEKEKDKTVANETNTNILSANNEEIEILSNCETKVKNADSTIISNVIKNDENNTNTSRQTLRSNMNMSNAMGKTIPKNKQTDYNEIISTLKSNLNRKESTKLSTSKNLKVFDFTGRKTIFKIQNEDKELEENIDQRVQGLLDSQKIIKSKTRNEYDNLKTCQELIKVEKISNEEAKKRDDILINFCYSIIEFFDNKKYNMDRLKPIDFSDIKKSTKDAQSNSLYKRLSVSEKKQYLKKLAEMRNQQNEMKIKRIDQILAEGRQINLIKIKSDLRSIPKLNFFCPFKDEEIYFTKKCILNDWVLPPPHFYEKYYTLHEEEENNNTNILTTENRENKLLESTKKIKLVKNPQTSQKKTSKKLQMKENNINANNLENNINNNDNIQKSNNKINQEENNFNNTENKKQGQTNANFNKSMNKKKPFYDETMHNLLEIKTNYSAENIKEPLIKFEGEGSWLNLYELKNIFNNYLLLYSPKNFKNNLNINNNWIYNYNNYEFNFDYAIIYLNNKNNLAKKESLTMLIFEPNSGIKDICNELNYFISIDVVESETAKLKENLKLTNFFCNFLLENLDKEKNYFLIIRSFLTPFGFNLNIFTDYNDIDYMNYNNYLQKIGNFYTNKFNIEHCNIEKNNNYLLAKFSLKLSPENKSKFSKMKINIVHKDNIITNQIEIYLMKGIDNESAKKINFNCIDLFTLNFGPENEEYFLIFMIKPLFDIKKNEFNVEFLYNNEGIKLKIIENLEPYKIVDRNKFDRNGCVFKEIMICTSSMYATMEVDVKLKKKKEINNKISFNSLCMFKKDSVNEDIIDKIDKLENKDSRYNLKQSNTNKNSKIIKNNNNTKKVRMNFKITRNNNIIFAEDFYDNLLIKNIKFDNEQIDTLSNILYDTKNKNSERVPKKDTYQYKFLCQFDLSELDKNLYEDDFTWEIRIFTSDSMIFCKDTSKEDNEIEVKKNWEKEEAGRSEMAKTSRFRFLAIKKQQKNVEILTEEEIKILNTERKKRPAHNLILDKINKRTIVEPKNISPKKGVNLKSKNSFQSPDVKNDYAKYEKLELKPYFVNSTSHKSNYIRNFIQYASMERTITKGEDIPLKHKIIISDEIRKKRIQSIDKNFYDFEYFKKTELDETQKKTENLKLFYQTTNCFRNQSREGSRNLMRQRDYLRGKLERLLDFEKNMNLILIQNNFDINYAKSIYEESEKIEDINQGLRDKLFNKIIERQNEFYGNESFRVSVKDKNLIIKYIDEIERSSKYKVNFDILERFRNLLKEFGNKKK